MEKETRNAIERATQRARKLLEEDFSAQLEGDFDVYESGAVAAKAGAHLSARQAFQREKIVAAIEHKRAAGMDAKGAVADYLRDAAFTTLNRFVALKMLEARDLVQECVTKGEQSSGYREFCGMAPKLPLLPESAGYRLYVESLFDELSTEVKVLFDRRDPSSVLWPKRATFEQLLEILNGAELAGVWGEDETIGWVYQFFNSLEERQAMKDVKSGGSQAPRNSRELATRNQFFTPRYIVRFLTDNTLGRLWWEMRGGVTGLHDRCESLTVKAGTKPPQRAKKDPRDIRVIDPACGSGHFLLYVFDLLLLIYDEAWADPASPTSAATGRSLRDDYPSEETLHAAVPELIVRHNLFGVDIDLRCVQVASFALWLRAQRAFIELRVPRPSRPRIERGHVILAEPMPGDAKLVREFAAQIEHPLLAGLFEQIVEAFTLAGDLGLMLRVERILDEAIRDAERSSRQGALFGATPTSRAFWETAERRLVEELSRFAAGVPGRDHERRRLFRHDATHGLALLDAARTKFDVVLMNPPFGEPSGPAKQHVEEAYPDSRQDLFAVFVDRSVRELAPDGLIGVISTDAGFFRRTLERFRRNVLIQSARLDTMVHLGGLILDGAKVRVAAYTLHAGQSTGASTYIRSLKGAREQREARVGEVIAALRQGASSEYAFFTNQEEFEKLPYAVFGYWCSPQMRNLFVENAQLEGRAGLVRQGLSTGDDFRFLRLRWEVSAPRVGNHGWMPFAKGGEYNPYYGDIHLVVGWHGDGQEMKAWAGTLYNDSHWTRIIKNVEHYRKPGLTYSRRAKRFAPRVMPGGSVFADKGPAIVEAPSNWALAALLNSTPIAYFLSFGTGSAETVELSNAFEVGLVQRLPVPAGALEDDALMQDARIAWLARAEEGLRDETAAVFQSPVAPLRIGATLGETWGELVVGKERTSSAYVAAQERIDRRVCELYGLKEKDWAEIVEDVGAVNGIEVAVDQGARGTWAQSLVSFLVGCSFGRWRPERLVAVSTVSADLAFAESPSHRDEGDGTPILVDDPGHPLDITQRCQAALESVAGEHTDRLLTEASEFLGVENLRHFLRKQFFDSHLKTYTKSRRTAPVFIPIAAGSGQYSVWLYLHRVGPDTLFTVNSEVIAPKLRLEEGRLAAMHADGAAGSAGRRQLATQQGLVDDLRALAEEVKRTAPLWKPHLDDGVIINFAPLWRLVPQNKSWQKELKSTWDALCEGEYDWAHLAMHLWPERVVPKCAKDRSLAIAHGLEEVFWVEDAKGKWTARKKPTRSVDELVRDRTSPAVKAALKSLLEAPVASGGSGRGRGGGQRKTASATEGEGR